MVLILATHTVGTVTAKVAFSTILLQDFITNRKLPAEFKCRQLIPTSGAVSTSLWDVSDPEALLEWLNNNINVDVQHSLFEVQEDFGIGLGEIHRARAADKVAKGIGAAASSAAQTATDIDHKLRISERASSAVEAVRESSVVQNTAAVLGKAGNSVKSATTKVLEQPAVVSATEAVGTGFRKLGASLSSLTGKVINRTNSSNGPVDIPNDEDFDVAEPKKADPPTTHPPASTSPIAP